MVLAGIGWEFVPSFVVYAPLSSSAAAAHEPSLAMPMASFIYVPAPAPDDGLDTTTAGHLLALGLEQFRVDEGREVYTVRHVLLPHALPRPLVIFAVEGRMLRIPGDREW